MYWLESYLQFDDKQQTTINAFLEATPYGSVPLHIVVCI